MGPFWAGFPHVRPNNFYHCTKLEKKINKQILGKPSNGHTYGQTDLWRSIDAKDHPCRRSKDENPKNQKGVIIVVNTFDLEPIKQDLYNVLKRV